jgi:hypothetical protein
MRPRIPLRSLPTRLQRLARLELPMASDARFASTRASLVLAEPPPAAGTRSGATSSTLRTPSWAMPARKGR